MAHTKTTARADIYQEITDRTIAAIERDGVAPWHKPWQGAASGAMPSNALTGRRYTGINVLSLMLSAWQHGWQSAQWVTFKQAKELAVKAARADGRNIEEREIGKYRNGKAKMGFWDVDADAFFMGGVRKGQKATGQIVFFRVVERKKPVKGKDDRYSMLRTSPAWNVEQCDGLPAECHPPKAVAPVKTDQQSPEAERVLGAWGDVVPVTHCGNRAFYSPADDHIQLPAVDAFEGWTEYYSTAFHEAAHSTGHTTRLGRDFDACKMWGDHAYSREELVAEFAACFMTASVGVARTATLDNSAAYLRCWVAKLKDDPKLLAQAAAAAQKAADLVLDTAAQADAPLVAEAKAA